MSSVTISGNPSGSGTFTVQSPNSNVSRTITLPDATTTLVGTDATQTLTNKTLTSSTIQGGTITQATAVTSTSGTSIDFTGIPSWAKRVTVMFNGVSISGTSDILVQLGTSGGVVTSGYVSTSTRAAWSQSSTAGFCVAIQSAAAAFSGVVKASNISGNGWVAETSGALSNGLFYYGGGGGVTLGGTLDRVRITTVNGTDTFDAGSINIMYEG